MTDQTADGREAKRARLYERYNNRALDTGRRLQGEFFLRLVEEYDELDPEWTEGWLTWIYDLQYNRGVLDEKRRVAVLAALDALPDRALVAAGVTT
jgi:hypothetical protein